MLLTTQIIGIIVFSFFLFSCSHTACAQNSEQHIIMELLKARELYKNGKSDEAIKVLKRAKNIDPTSARPYAALAELFKILRKYDEAIEEYKEALKLDTTSAELYQLLAEVYIIKAEVIEKGEIKGDSKEARREAAKAFERIFELEYSKDSTERKKEMCKKLVENYIILGEYDNALIAVGKWKKLAPDDSDADLAAGGIYLKKKDYKRAREEFLKVEQSLTSSEGSKKVAGEKLALVTKEEKKQFFDLVKWIGIGVATLMVISIILLLAIKFRSKKGEDREEGVEPEREKDRDDSLEDLNSFEGICKMALNKMMRLTQMPKGVVFLPNDIETLLVPTATYGIDKDIEPLEYSALDARDWIVEKEGLPFIFKLERREISFARAFPDSSNVLGDLEMRIGVPIVLHSKFLGIVYLGCPESRDKVKFKKLYEQNRPLISKVAQEIAELLDELISRRQAITDSFTGLFNEAYFKEKLPQLIDEARTKSKTCSLILVAIDGYKDLIETFGEDYGEKLIKMSAIALSTAIANTNSVLCRIKDTRFAIIYPEASTDMANELIEKLREEISSVKIARHIPPATASIAVGTFPATAIYAEKLNELVADSLEKAQSEGGNRVLIAEKKLRTMETTKMTRDQVLAAVERRRQVRKAMKTGTEELILEKGQPARELERGRPIQDHGEPKQPSMGVPYIPEEKKTPAASWQGSQSLPRSQPVSPIHIDVKEREEQIPHYSPLKDAQSGAQQADLSVQARQKKLLSVSQKGESPERQKSVSPFVRRTQFTSEAAPPEDAGESEDMKGAALPSRSGRDLSPANMMANMRMENSRGGRLNTQDQLGPQTHIVPGQRARAGGPSGPLDFTKEMQTIEQKEREAQRKVPQEGGARLRPVPLQEPQMQQPAVKISPSAERPFKGQEGPAVQQPRTSVQSTQPFQQAHENITSDPLTGFYHRSYFEKVLLAEAQKLRQNPGECTLVYFGLDNFEQLKTSHGSPKIRKVIKDLTEQLRVHMDEGRGIPGRIEENGFALFLPYTSLDTGNEIATKMRVTAYNLKFYDFGQTITISLGISSYPKTVKNFREIVVNSRKAMEKAMKSGGNKVEIGFAP